MTQYNWYAGWYATRLHAVDADNKDANTQALCGAHVYNPLPPSDWAQRRFRRGVGRCKHCERAVRKTGRIPPDEALRQEGADARTREMVRTLWVFSGESTLEELAYYFQDIYPTAFDGHPNPFDDGVEE